MYRKKVIATLSLTAVILAMMTMSAMAATYQINTLHNWGVTLNNDSSGDLSNSDWIPDSLTVDYVVEDNMDAQWSGDGEFKPLTYTGYHKNSQDGDWKEPKIKTKGGHLCIQPSGAEYTANSRELNDIEAFYFDSDSTNAYFAIVVSKPLNMMGDLALDLNGDSVYEYGIVLLDHNPLTKGDVCSVTSWTEPSDFSDTGPYRVKTWSTKQNAATVSIVDSGVSDHGTTNHVIEISVPRTALGNPSFSNLHATTSCGNDVVELENVAWEVPEFSTIAVPLGMTLGLFYYYRRKRQREERVGGK